MPVGRIILKSISQSRKMALLKTPSRPGDGARTLFSWLLAHVDINGCFTGDANLIKSFVFTLLPHSIEEIEAFLQEMESVGLIVRYVANNEKYLQIVNFVKYQPYLNKDRESSPVIPLPPREIAESSKLKAQSESPQPLPSGKLPISEKGKSGPRKAGHAPIPEVKLIIDLYFKYYTDPHIGGYKVKPLISGKAEGNLLRQLVTGLKRDEVWTYTKKPFMDVMAQVLKSYLLDKADFLKKRKHDLRLFYSSFNTWWLPIKEQLWAQHQAEQRSGSGPRGSEVRSIGSILNKVRR